MIQENSNPIPPPPTKRSSRMFSTMRWTLSVVGWGSIVLSLGICLMVLWLMLEGRNLDEREYYGNLFMALAFVGIPAAFWLLLGLAALGIRRFLRPSKCPNSGHLKTVIVAVCTIALLSTFLVAVAAILDELFYIPIS